MFVCMFFFFILFVYVTMCFPLAYTHDTTCAESAVKHQPTSNKPNNYDDDDDDDDSDAYIIVQADAES